MSDVEPQFGNGATSALTSMPNRGRHSRKDLMPLPIVHDI